MCSLRITSSVHRTNLICYEYVYKYNTTLSKIIIGSWKFFAARALNFNVIFGSFIQINENTVQLKYLTYLEYLVLRLIMQYYEKLFIDIKLNVSFLITEY